MILYNCNFMFSGWSGW